MSWRRDAVERFADREEKRLASDLAEGRISPEEYNQAMFDLQREVQWEARAAMDEDIHDAMDDWRW